MSKGGMCTSPFAGFPRPDKLDLRELLGPNDPPEKAIILATIVDAFTNFCYFGLGDAAPDGSPRGNGTTAANFYYDFLYLFMVRWSVPHTWEHARETEDNSVDEVTGKRRKRRVVLTDEQLRMCCFDTHFGLLNFPFSMDRFLQMVREHRQDVLTKEGPRIQEHVRLLRSVSVAQYAPGHALPLFNDANDEDLRVLLAPRSAEEVEDLVGYVPKCLKAKKARERCVPAFKPAVIGATRRLILAELKGPLFDSLEASVSGIPHDPGRCRPRIAA